MPIDKTYLGDSVYVSYDGFEFTLTTENGYPDDPSNEVILEPQVVKALIEFIEKKKAVLLNLKGK